MLLYDRFEQRSQSRCIGDTTVQVIFSQAQSAQRDIKGLKERLSQEEFQRIISRILELSGTPRPVGVRKIVGSKSDWRLRTGKYRIIYEIDDHYKAVRILRVKHRREVYR
ncbi:MAG: type II toxin-antitoxin system RelE/ParE family toxin [Candidatus Desantisbacteria bacterium]